MDTGIRSKKSGSFLSQPSARIFLPLSILLLLSVGHSEAQTNELANRMVNALISSPLGQVYAATDSGVFMSTNRGDSWTRVNSGLTVLSVKSLAIDSAGRLFAGTTAGQIFRSANSVVSSVNEIVSQVPMPFSLEQNYPNPFNPSTTIEFSLLSSGYVSLKVFNVLGVEVATLLQEELRAGRYAKRWEALELPSGVYFCRLQVSGLIQTRKLILMK
jgi:hypothetical protein